MEAIMPSGTKQLVIGMVVAIGVAIISAIGSAAVFERAHPSAPETPAGGAKPLSDADVRLVDRQQLRRIFFDEPRNRLR